MLEGVKKARRHDIRVEGGSTFHHHAFASLTMRSTFVVGAWGPHPFPPACLEPFQHNASAVRERWILES